MTLHALSRFYLKSTLARGPKFGVNYTILELAHEYDFSLKYLQLADTMGWANPEQAASLNTFLLERGWMDIAVALIGSMLVGVSMILMAFFNDFPRGYYIAIMAALAVFLMIWLNQPIFPILLGLMIVLPGVVLLIRFLSKYPLPKQEASHG